MRRKRERDLFGVGHCMLSPGSGYRLDDVARFLGVKYEQVRLLGKELGVLRKPEGDHRYAPLTQAQAKLLIQTCRAR